MITKSDLKTYRRIRDQCGGLRAQILTLERLAGDVRSVNYDRVVVQTPYSGSCVEFSVQRIAELVERYNARIAELTSLQARIEAEVERLPSEEDRRLIRLRYFVGLSCEDCANALHINLRTFHKWHSKILIQLGTQRHTEPC